MSFKAAYSSSSFSAPGVKSPSHLLMQLPFSLVQTFTTAQVSSENSTRQLCMEKYQNFYHRVCCVCSLIQCRLVGGLLAHMVVWKTHTHQASMRVCIPAGHSHVHSFHALGLCSTTPDNVSIEIENICIPCPAHLLICSHAAKAHSVFYYMSTSTVTTDTTHTREVTRKTFKKNGTRSDIISVCFIKEN